MPTFCSIFRRANKRQFNMTKQKVPSEFKGLNPAKMDVSIERCFRFHLQSTLFLIAFTLVQQDTIAKRLLLLYERRLKCQNSFKYIPNTFKHVKLHSKNTRKTKKTPNSPIGPIVNIALQSGFGSLPGLWGKSWLHGSKRKFLLLIWMEPGLHLNFRFLV